MEQAYYPNLLVPALPAYCLMYVDDAGQAPFRVATARYSYQVERDAGRISTGELPDNVWVVGYMDFTQGRYTAYGHVFFIKRSGGSVQIYDSEVQSGARQPYGSIAELQAWFGAYKPAYLGWSTQCDGRVYAKQKEDEVKPTEAQVVDTFRTYLLSDPVNRAQINYYMGLDIRVLLQDVLNATKPSGQEVKDTFQRFLPGTSDPNRDRYYTSKIRAQMLGDIAGVLNDKIKALEQAGMGDFEVATVYVKKKK